MKFCIVKKLVQQNFTQAFWDQLKNRGVHANEPITFQNGAYSVSLYNRLQSISDSQCSVVVWGGREQNGSVTIGTRGAHSNATATEYEEETSYW